jgi:acetyltransferase-like isoleucine patch superfamily enzyme
MQYALCTMHTMSRRDRLHTRAAPGDKNSLAYWWQDVHPLRVVWNFLCIYAAKYAPSLMMKRGFLRLTGMKVGREVSFGLACTIDVFFPNLVEVGDNSIIGFNSVVLAHEYMVKERRIGPVKIGRDVSIGANVTILPGVVIGDGAMISAMSLVNKDVPPGEFWGGIPIRKLERSEGDEALRAKSEDPSPFTLNA